MIAKRPIISLIVFNENDLNIKTLYESIEKLDNDIKVRMEFWYVVFDKKLSKENKDMIMALKRFMPIKVTDYSEKVGKDNLELYGRGFKKIKKDPYDRVTNYELSQLIKDYKEGK